MPALILWGVAGVLWAKSPVSVRVQSAPLRFQQTETTTTSETVIHGPGGQRRIRTSDRNQVDESPGQVTSAADSHTEVTGVQNPGISFERQIVFPNGPAPIVSATPRVVGGPGSIDSHSTSKRSQTPQVDIQAR